MLKQNLLAQIAACAAGLGLVLPTGTLTAAERPIVQQSRQTTNDVVLASNTLTGQYLTSQGVPVDGAVISVRRDGEELTKTTTDAKGVFVVKGLKSGVYEVATPSGVELVRAWEATTAPPAATPVATIVSRGNVVRGEFGGGNTGLILVGALGIAGLTTGIIGISKANDAQDDVDGLKSP